MASQGVRHRALRNAVIGPICDGLSPETRAGMVRSKLKMWGVTSMDRRQLCLGISTLAVASAALTPSLALAQDAALSASVNAAGRDPGNKARDAFRHPVQSLGFWGVKPGQTVVEINPGGGTPYWTEILAPYAKATGGKYVATGAANPKYPDATFVPFSATSGALVPAGTADVVLTARNIHNWMWQPGMLDKAMKDFHTALKPGGILAVEEHRADPKPQVNEGGRSASNGYVATANVIAAAEKAGFKLDAQSDINANPKDTKDHPFGVWTLPPTRQSAASRTAATAPDFNRAKYDAIGESDRMTLRFRKV
jgi:predicted methyltransferase